MVQKHVYITYKYSQNTRHQTYTISDKGYYVKKKIHTKQSRGNVIASYPLEHLTLRVSFK